MNDREICLSIHFTAEQVNLIKQFQEVPESDHRRFISQLAAAALNLKNQDLTLKQFLEDREKACIEITTAISTILSEKDHLHSFDRQGAEQGDLFSKLEKFQQALILPPGKKGRKIDAAERFTLWSLWGIFKRLKLPIKTHARNLKDPILSQVPHHFLQIAQVVYAAAGREKKQEAISQQVSRAKLLKDPFRNSNPGQNGIAFGALPPFIVGRDCDVDHTYHDDGSYTMTVRYKPTHPK